MFKTVCATTFLRIRILNVEFVSVRAGLALFGVRVLVFSLAWLAVAAGAPATDNIGILGTKPKWDVLEHYQHTITHDEFTHLVNDVYCTHGIPNDLIRIDADSAQIV